MIGERLADLRKDKGWTQGELAEKLGLSVHTIGSYEQNRTQPDDEMKLKISKLFDVSVDYFIGGINYEASLSRINSIDLPADFPSEAIVDVRKYINLIYENYKFHEKTNQKK